MKAISLEQLKMYTGQDPEGFYQNLQPCYLQKDVERVLKEVERRYLERDEMLVYPDYPERSSHYRSGMSTVMVWFKQELAKLEDGE